MKIKTQHEQIVECVEHGRRRQWRNRVAKPTNKCLACWLIYLADAIDYPTYPEDVEAFIAFSNAFPKKLRASSLQYEDEDA